MKTFRLLVALLVVALFAAPAFPQDSGEIAALLVKARRGNGIAQYNLGLAYAEGKGVATDPIEAFVWLSLARENGARGRALDNFMGSVDKGILEQAQHRLTERKAELGVHSTSSVIVRTSSPASVPTAKPATPAVTPPPAPLATAAPADPVALAAEVAALRAERERLINASAEHDKSARIATEGNQALQEQARTAEAKAAELARSVDTMKGELARVRLALTAAQKAAATPAKPATSTPPAYPDLTGRVAELENAFTAASTSLAQAQAALAAKQAAPAAPSHPDLSGRVTELEAQLANLASEANRAKQEVAALTKAKEEANAALKAKPVSPNFPDLRDRVAQLERDLATAHASSTDTAALAQKTRELQAALADLEEARTFGRKVEDTLNKVNDDKARVAATAAAELAEARAFGAQVENTLNKVSDQKAALESSLRAAESARDSYASEFAAAKAQLAAVKSATPVAPSTPAYPDLSGKVAELQGQVAKLSSDLTTATSAKADALARVAALSAKAAPAAPAYPDLTSRVAELEKTNAALKSEAVHAQQEAGALIKANDALKARSTAPSYPDLSGKVATLESTLAAANASLALAQVTLAAKPAAPSFPDLRSRVSELEIKLGDAEKSLAAKPAAPAYPDLRGNVTELEAKVAALTAESTRAKQEMAALTKAKDDVSQTGEASIRSLSRELETTKTALAQANGSLKAKPAPPAYPNLTGRVAELESAYTAASTSLAQAQAALAAKPVLPSFPDLRERVAQLESQLVAARASAPTYPDLSSRVAELEARLAKPAAPIYPNLSGKVTELETALATLAKAKDDATQKAASAELARSNGAKEFDDYKNASATAQRERTTLLASVKLLESDKVSLRRQAESAGTESTQLRSQVATLKEQLSAKPVAAAAPSYPDLSGKVAVLEASLAAKSSAPAYPDLSAKVAELEGSLRDSTRQVAAASTEADRAQREIAQLNKAIAEKPKAVVPAYPDYTNLVKEMTAEVGKLRGEREHQAGDLAAGTRRVQELENQVGMLQATVAAKPTALTYPDLSGKVAELQDQLAKMSTDLSAASSAKADALAQVAALNKAKEKHSEPITAGGNNYYPDLSPRVRELETQLAAASKVRAPAYPDLSGRVTDLEAQLAKAASAAPDLSGKVAELSQQLAAMENASKIKGDSVTELEGKLRKQTAAVQEAGKAKGTIDSLTSEVTQLREDRERMQKVIADSGRKLRDSSADTTRIKELETQAAGLQASLTTAQTRAGELQTALAAKPAAPAYPDLSGKVAELESKVAALNKAKEARSEPITAGGNYYPDLSGRVRELEAQLAAAPKNRAPAYPDLSGRVRELETQLTDASSEAARAKRETAALAKAKDEPRAPAYPDLRSRVTELETKLAQAASQPAAADASDLQKRLADTENRLATSLRGYALLEKERDALQAKSGQASEALTAKVATLTVQVEQLQSSTAAQTTNTNTALAAAQAENTRLSESLAALQRSTGQVAGDAASNRALVQQLQGANTVLAQENYQLKTVLARASGGSVPAAPASALVSPPAARIHVVASGDSLSKLSQRYYGTAGRWQEIYNANAGRLGPNGILRIGTELRIP